MLYILCTYLLAVEPCYRPARRRRRRRERKSHGSAGEPSRQSREEEEKGKERPPVALGDALADPHAVVVSQAERAPVDCVVDVPFRRTPPGAEKQKQSRAAGGGEREVGTNAAAERT